MPLNCTPDLRDNEENLSCGPSLFRLIQFERPWKRINQMNPIVPCPNSVSYKGFEEKIRRGTGGGGGGYHLRILVEGNLVAVVLLV